MRATGKEIVACRRIGIRTPLQRELTDQYMFTIPTGKRMRLIVLRIGERVLRAFLFHGRHLLIRTTIGERGRRTRAQRFIRTRRTTTRDRRRRHHDGLFPARDFPCSVARDQPVTIRRARHQPRRIRPNNLRGSAHPDFAFRGRAGVRKTSFPLKLFFTHILEVVAGTRQHPTRGLDRDRDRPRRRKQRTIPRDRRLRNTTQRIYEFDRVRTMSDTRHPHIGLATDTRQSGKRLRYVRR